MTRSRGYQREMPAASVPVQASVPSLTVTSPEGVPIVELTVKVTVNSVFTLDGSGVWPVMAVVETALFTVCGMPAEVLGLKFASPA